MPRITLLALLLLSATAALHAVARADSVPFWGAKASVPIDTPINRLHRGEFLWMGNAVASGPLVMVVSLNEQRAYVYRNGVLIGATSVSTGRPGHLTPTGVFTVLQKQQEHRSTIYDGAPMPYMERLTWSGIALHAGGLPGYPESHGCIHLPSEFAKLLFDTTTMGMTVVIANQASQPRQVAYPGYLVPVSFHGGQPIGHAPLAPAEKDRWQPQRSPSGPISIVVSQRSRRVVVYRNGIEIGRARLEVKSDEPFRSHTLILTDSPSTMPDPYVPDPTKYRWMLIGAPGDTGEAGTEISAASLAKISLPEEFVREVDAILTPGATVFVTDQPLTPESSGTSLQVLDADPPATDPPPRL
ncbi:MAG TPA: L,D-transpeptidase [Burkholderiales bacterium]|nr:L,D-transpeptidase [Burkholderiales bacterium]